MKTRIFLSILIFAALLIVNKSAFAVQESTSSVPTFPVCTDPQGALKVYYSEGTHGVPGSESVYTGEDTVYSLSEETLSQCLCKDDGTGIQTSWWKVSSLTIEQIEQLTADGWVYVPNGAEWGLEEAPYLAKNEKYLCAGGIGGPRGGDDGDDDDNDDDNDDDDDKEESEEDQEGEILGTTTLAGTGNMRTIALYLGIAIAFLSAAVVAYKKHAKA